MSEIFLPSMLQGDGCEAVNKATSKAAKAIARRKSIEHAVNPTPSPDSQRSSVPVYLSRVISGEGFHVSGLLPQVNEAWMNRAVELDNAGFDEAVNEASAIYTDLLSRPWGVLCALAYDSFVWLRLGYSPDEDINPQRVIFFLEALKREQPFIKLLDGRYAGPLLEKPEHPWNVHNLLNFLAARNNLPAPSSWATWDATVNKLLEHYRNLIR